MLNQMSELETLHQKFYPHDKKSFFMAAKIHNPHIRLCIKNHLPLDYQPILDPDTNLFAIELSCKHVVTIQPEDLSFFDTHTIKCEQCAEQRRSMGQVIKILKPENQLQCSFCERKYQREVNKLTYNLTQFKCFCQKTVTKQAGEMKLFDHLQREFDIQNVFCNYVHQEEVRNRRTSDFYLKLQNDSGDNVTVVIELDDISHTQEKNKNSDIIKMNLVAAQNGVKMLHIDQAMLDQLIRENLLASVITNLLEREECLFFVYHSDKTSQSCFRHILAREDVVKIDLKE